MLENQIEIIGNREVELLEKQRKVNLQKLFTPEGMESIINTIKKEVADFKADVSTKEGRAKIISMAAKVAKCKSPIEKLAKEAKDESQKIIAGIQTEWKRYESEMDTLRDEIRKPVDEIEEREAAQLKACQDRLAAMENIRSMTNGVTIASSEFQKLIEEVKNYLQFDWGDFAFKAETLANELISHFQLRETFTKKAEADQAELAQLKKEKAERDQKDYEERIAREAALAATIAAEKEAEKERQAAIEREAKIEADKKAAEQAKINAENRAKEAERLAKEQTEQAEQRRIAAEKKAREDAEKAASDAIEKERLRIAEEKRKEDEALAKREANRKHCAKINNEAKIVINQAMTEITQSYWGSPLGEEQQEIIENAAKLIIELIAKGKVPNVQINY